MDDTQSLKVVAKISSKNQITIPREIRRKLNLDGQDEVVFELKPNGEVLFKKQTNKDLWDIVAEQQAKYGTFDTETFDWGPAVGDEVID